MSQKAYVLTLALAALAPQMAWAADEDSYLEDEPEERKKKGGSKATAEDPGIVREISRGFYGKANVGAAAYLGSFSPVVSAGTYVALAVGMDFVDNEKQSMAWEVGLHQGLHNGTDALTQHDALGCVTDGTGPAPCTQGDLRTYTITANYEFSYYVTRRVGIGARVGGGVLYSPLFIEPTAWEEDYVVRGSGNAGLHDAPKPLVFAGPTLEYYTKLSHFSVGLDVDVFYGIGWDLGFNGSGALKYTF
ncbi:MAG: adventurous gliding motility protein CglE [Myxococcota bacterium]